MRNLRTLLLACSLAAAPVLTGCAATRAAPPATPLPEPTIARASGQPHAVQLIVGGSFDRAGDGVAVGAQYEFKKDDRIGFGAFGDVAFGKRTSTVLGGAVYFHPKEPWTVFAGPGVEFTSGDADAIARVGGAYAFEVEQYTVSPIAWIDLGNDVALFLGAAFGFDF